jgi:threonine aldolase
LTQDYISRVKDIARKNNMIMHLDASRGLNAAVALNITPAEMVKDFDTVNFCLRKGLRCPEGSLIIGSTEDIAHARKLRDMFRGEMS